MKHTHSQKLETWLGKEKLNALSQAMRDFYWPVAVHGVPGNVVAMPGGDFTGGIDAGGFASAPDMAVDRLNRYYREQRAKVSEHKIAFSRGRLRGAMDRRQHAFSSLSSLIAAATGGKAQNLFFNKISVASNAIGNCVDLWAQGNTPVAGAAGAAAPGGTAFVSTANGALGYANPSSANTGHFTTGWASASVASNTLLLYDRLFAVAKTMNSTATEAVSGTFSRYQNLTANTSDYVGGNFLFTSVPTTVLAATAHNWTVVKYTSQANVANQSCGTVAGVSACVKFGVDLPPSTWFMPLATGDVGVKALTQMQCSALVATGTVDFVVGHPIAFLPCPIAQLLCVVDGINTAFNLTSVYDNACLALLEMPKPATTATTYNGQITIVSE